MRTSDPAFPTYNGICPRFRFSTPTKIFLGPGSCVILPLDTMTDYCGPLGVCNVDNVGSSAVAWS